MLRIQKQLGIGVNGIVNLGSYDGNKVIVKMEKYDGDYSTKSSFIRQIKFDEVARGHPAFMKLVMNGVKYDCTYTQPIPNWITDKKLLKHLNEKNQYKYCSILCYEPVLDYTLKQIRDKIVLTRAQFRSLVIQIISAIKFLQLNGYSHRDIHDGNIMCKVSGFPLSAKSKFTWYLIDYGLIHHKSFEKNFDDCESRLSDILMFIQYLILTPVIDMMIKKSMLLPQITTMVKHIKSDPRYKSILLLTLKSRYQNDLLVLVTIITHYDLYIESLGLDPNKYPAPDQTDPDLILYMIQHCNNIKLISDKLKSK